MPSNRVKGFIGPSYKIRAHTLDSARTVNLYAEVDESGNGKDGNVAAFIGTPGKRKLITLGNGPIRGFYNASNGQFFCVSGSTLYRINTDLGSAATIGTVSGTSGRVSFADNGTVLCLVASGAGFIHTFNSGTVSQITDPDFYATDSVAFLDGYFVFNRRGTGQFFISGLYGTDFDALDFATAEASPDRLVGVVANNRELWMFGTKTIEIFYNSGDVTFPFNRQGGAVIEKGCSNFNTISKLNNTLFWLGSDEQGAGVVWMANGYTPKRISNHAVEFAIQSYNVANASAYSYEQEGHYFYCLNFPTANTTWCYDLTTDMWHERCYTDPDTGEQERDRAECFGFFSNTRIVGDWEDGRVYALDLDWYRDDTDAIKRIRTSPHTASDLNDVFFTTFQIDMDVGVGLDGIPLSVDPLVQTGQQPQAMLRWSDDGGRTWSNEQWREIGPLGSYRTRVKWQRLGRGRDRVWQLVITDPVKIAIVGAYFDAQAGRS